SRPGERRTGSVSRGKREQASGATHVLESGGRAASARAKESEQVEPLTPWRAEDGQRQQGQKRASKWSHSRPGERRTGSVSRGKRERASGTTHKLESGGRAASAGAKESKQVEPLTSWRAEDGQRQHGQKRASKWNHSQTGERRMGSVSRGKRERASGATHVLESGGRAASAGAKESEQAEPLTDWR